MAVAKRVRGTRFVPAQFRATAMQAALVRQLTDTVPWPDTSPVSRSPGSCGDRNTPSPEVLSMRFSYCMVPEVYQLFWAAMARGEFITDAAAEAGTYRKQGTRWLVAAGGVRPRRGRGLKGRCLTLAQREEIALGRARGQSVRSIAAAIGRSPSTVSRELRRNADRLGGYRATTAHALAYAHASRPKTAKLVTSKTVDRGSIGDVRRAGLLAGRQSSHHETLASLISCRDPCLDPELDFPCSLKTETAPTGAAAHVEP